MIDKMKKDDLKYMIYVEKQASLEKNARSPKFEGMAYRLVLCS